MEEPRAYQLLTPASRFAYTASLNIVPCELFRLFWPNLPPDFSFAKRASDGCLEVFSRGDLWLSDAHHKP